MQNRTEKGRTGSCRRESIDHVIVFDEQRL
jgi:hypothetical protein